MIQMAFTVLCIVATPWNVHFGSLRDVLRWTLTIPVLFTAMLASSMLALDHASMGAIIVVRNIAPIGVQCTIPRAQRSHWREIERLLLLLCGAHARADTGTRLLSLIAHGHSFSLTPPPRALLPTSPPHMLLPALLTAVTMVIERFFQEKIQLNVGSIVSLVCVVG